MKYIAWTTYNGKRFENADEVKKHFNISDEELDTAVNTGKPVSLGIRYWYIDEQLESGE